MTVGWPNSAITSADRQLPARIGRLLDGVEEAMEADGGVEGWRAAFARPNRFGEQGVQLADVERVAAGEVVGKVEESSGYLQVCQGLAVLGALDAQHFATLG